MLTCALLAGCGGGDDDGGGSGDGPTREDFAAQVNEICEEGEQEIASIEPEGGDTRQAAADALEEASEAYQPYLDRLHDVEAPEEIADEYSRFLDGIESAFNKIPEVAEATRENDEEKLQELADEFTQIAQDTRPFAEENRLSGCLPDAQG